MMKRDNFLRFGKKKKLIKISNILDAEMIKSNIFAIQVKLIFTKVKKKMKS